MPEPHLNPAVRHDFVFLFDVVDGNPNGDPDAANQPRLDPETGHGLVTDVAIKRKIRNYVAVARPDETHKVFIEAGVPLNSQMRRAYTELGLEGKKAKGRNPESVKEAQAWMCQNFYDVRLFGAVMATGDYDAGRVQGPVQITFARSVDPIVPTEHAITRVAPTREEDANKETEMGSEWTVPYGLYRLHGFYSAHLAERTGVTTDDLALLYQALLNMFDLDRSAARGQLAARALHVFSHASKLGDAPAHQLLERMTVTQLDSNRAVRQFADYRVDLPAPNELASAVTLTSLL